MTVNSDELVARCSFKTLNNFMSLVIHVKDI